MANFLNWGLPIFSSKELHSDAVLSEEGCFILKSGGVLYVLALRDVVLCMHSQGLEKGRIVKGFIIYIEGTSYQGSGAMYILYI